MIVATLMVVAGAPRFYTMGALDAFLVSTAIAGVVEVADCLFIPWHRYPVLQANA